MCKKKKCLFVSNYIDIYEYEQIYKNNKLGIQIQKVIKLIVDGF